MDVSTDEYHSANDDSFANAGYTTVATAKIVQTTATLAARKQLTSTSNVDTSEPAKPLSAYGLFFRDTVSAIKQQNPNCTFQELSRIVSSMWEALDVNHKNIYSKKHEVALTEYMKQMRTYRQHQEEQLQLQQQQQQQQQQQHHQILITNASESNVNSPASAALQTKPAVFTISRINADGSNTNQVVLNAAQAQIQTPQANIQSNSVATTTTTTVQPNDPQQPQIQMLSEAGAVQKCTRENCNKRAIINPDWEDEYCSNECVVIHCRNVFNTWVQSNLESRKQ